VIIPTLTLVLDVALMVLLEILDGIREGAIEIVMLGPGEF